MTEQKIAKKQQRMNKDESKRNQTFLFLKFVKILTYRCKNSSIKFYTWMSGILIFCC